MDGPSFDLQRFTVYGTEGNETLYADSNYSYVFAYGGNDSIYNSYTGVQIYAGTGNDSIANYGSWTTIYSGEGNDKIYNSAVNYVYVSGGTGDDSISNYSAFFSTIDGGTGDDTIVVPYRAWSDWIYGGTGNDRISLGTTSNEAYNGYNTIVGGTGNDTIYGNPNATVGNVYQYFYGDGYDVITNWNAKDTVNFGSGVYYTRSTVGSNVLLGIVNSSGTVGAVTLSGASGKTINISGGTQTILSNNVYGTSGKDNLRVKASNSSVIAYGGNDSIYNGAWDSVTIDAGDGDDTITNSIGWDISINGGAGNDKISLSGSQWRVTVKGGTGNDTLYGSTSTYNDGIVYQYGVGDGYDSIVNWRSTDTLNFGSGVYYTRSTVNGNVLLGIVNSSGTVGAVTLSGASGKTINISGGTQTILSNNVYGTSGKDNLRVKASNSSVIAYGGNDSIYNGAWDSVTIDAGDGDDTITNSIGWDISINGGAGNDKISLSGSQWRVTVKGGTGNDTLYGSTSTYNDGIVYQYGVGDGYDSIVNWRSTDTLNFGSGVYYTRSTVNGNVLLGIVNSSGTVGAVTLSGASGKTINISGGTPTILSSVIYNYNKNSLVSGSSSADTIDNYAGGATLRGNGGNDYIYNSTSSYYTVNGGYGYVTIDGGDGNDTIKSYDPYVSLSGGAGADVISLRPSGFTNVTINGGTGNDTIYGDSISGVLYQYKKGDGNDLIYNYSAKDTITITGGGNWSTVTSNNDVIVNVADSGNMTLVGAKGKTLNIYPTSTPTILPNVITNYNKNSLVSGSSSAESIYNYAGGATIRGNGGNDYIYNSTSSYYTVNGGYGYVTIDGGDGNDTIKSWDPRASINGGDGTDLISLKSWNSTDVTINAGKGNDTIYGDSLGGILYQYKKGDGNDLIYNYSAKDTITITGGGNWSTVTSNNDVIVNVADSGNMTLVGAKGKTLNINPDTVIVTPQAVIKKFMKSLDTTSNVGIAALNEAASVASGGYFTNINAAINQMVADCRTTNNATGFLSEYCGIDLTNTDTGAITGYDAGGSATQKSASDIVPESGSLDSFTGNSFTTNGLTVVLSDFDRDMNPYGISYGNLSNSAQRYIWQALETWWAENSLDLIAQSYGDNYSFTSASNATVKKLYFGFVNDNNNTLATTWTWNPRGNASQLAMTVNMKYYNDVTVGNADGKTSATSTYLDRTLAHEFTHAVMSANIYSVGNLPQFIKEGMSELTHGIDDQRDGVIRSLAGNANSLAGSLSLFDTGTGISHAYAGGYMFLRYLAKQGSLHYPSSTSSSATASQNKSSDTASSSISSAVSLKGAVLTLSKNFNDDILDLTKYSTAKTVNATATGTGIMIIGNKNPLSISAGTGNDSIFANVGNDTLSGGAGKDILYGEAGNDVIKGDAGDDSINGGTGNDTLTGGDGKDVFIFGTNSDNDVITDYTPGQDKIKLIDGGITSSSIKGSDVVLQMGLSDTVTIKGGKDQKITVIDGDGKETTKVYVNSGGDDPTPSPGKTLKVTKTPVTLDSSYANADASSMKKAVKITGNDAANSIVGGTKNDSLYGGDGNDTLLGKTGNDKIYGQAGNDVLHGDAGNDSLWGGAGDDTLFGDAGNDLFVYGAGKDVIADFAAGDKISIGAAVSKSTVSGSDVVFTIGDGTLTVKDAKGKTLSMIDKSGKAYTTVVGGDDTLVGGKTLKVTKTKVTLDSSYANADASTMKSAVNITGNDLANSIVGGTKNDSLYGGAGNDTLLGKTGNDKIYGQAGNDVLYGDAGNDYLSGGSGNDSLWGGAGNDTLFGGDGDDVFIYGAGKDVISGFETGDLLQISETFTGTYNKSKNTISIKVGSTASAITIKDFTATTFNINGDSYGISGTKLVKT